MVSRQQVLDVLDGAEQVYAALAYRPEVFRCARDVWGRLAASDRGTVPLVGGYDLQVFGMRVEVDEYLPRGVWRLCDGAGTALFDCRQGRPGREW